VYLFQHETLRAIAEEQLGFDLHSYRQRIHRWAEPYREQKWPPATPRYLLRPYSRLLAAGQDLPRLVALLSDAHRHDRMLAATLTDATALAEITDAQQLLLGQPEPDLAALGLFAVERHRISLRNHALPAELPAVWVTLGQPDRAEALAHSITDLERRVTALSAVARALVQVGQWERAAQLAISAEQLRRVVMGRFSRAGGRATRGVALALAQAGQGDWAERVARAIVEPDEQTRVLSWITYHLVVAG
jgi:hypothetical protein